MYQVGTSNVEEFNSDSFGFGFGLSKQPSDILPYKNLNIFDNIFR